MNIMTRRSQIVTFFIIIGLVATAWFVTRARATERVSEDGIEPNQARTDEMKPQPN